MSAILRRSLLGAPVLAWLWAKAPPLLAAPAPQPDTEWRAYAGDLRSNRYAPLDQINAANFSDLEVAWRFKPDNFGPRAETSFETTPLVVKGRMYTTVGTRRDVVALDAATGELLWMHRLDEGERADKAPRKLSGRGLSYWTDGTEERILYVTIGYQLVALDAKTGRQIPGFGNGGIVDLKQDFDQVLDADNDDVGLHSTPCVAKNVVIVGAAHTTGRAPRRHRNAKGYVRGFDVRTGKRLWTFHTIPQKGEFGYDTWLEGTAEESGNTGVWAQVSVDLDLNLAYLPVELPTGDYVGIYRKGDGLFGESIVAVDLDTGQRKWHYQLVHHGIWDSDIPCAPILMDVPIDGKIRKLLAQPTKQAWLYVLDRETGKPIWPIVERKVAKGDTPGEYYAPTQPFVTKPPAYDLQGVAVGDLIDFTPELRAEAVELVKNYRIGPIFTPPSVATAEGTWGTIVAPGPTGGANWPGGSADPETGVLYVYSKSDPDVLGLVPSPSADVSDFAYISTRGGTNLPARGRFRPGVVQVQGLPLIKPPYGRITAIDLKKGDFLWQVVHGETPDAIKNHPALKGLTLPRTGQAGLVGTLVTKSLVIAGEPIAYTTQGGRRGAMMRAYDKATGQERGAVYMPAPVTGAPMTYMLGGVQYLVAAVGGGAYTGELLAYRLPKA
jgi:quinoprotein glucose dehydrogenase